LARTNTCGLLVDLLTQTKVISPAALALLTTPICIPNTAVTAIRSRESVFLAVNFCEKVLIILATNQLNCI
jgi:hypothetical protein